MGKAGPTFVLSCPFVVCARGCPPHLSVFTASLDITLFWPSVGVGFWHQLFRAFRVLVARARHRFLWPGRQCSDFAWVLVFYIGGLERCMILASMGFSDAIWGIGHSERLMMALMIMMYSHMNMCST